MAYVIFAFLGFCGGAFSVFMVLEGRRSEIRAQRAAIDSDTKAVEGRSTELKNGLAELQQRREANRLEYERFQHQRGEFDRRTIAYAELLEENSLLKRDLRNVFLDVRKATLDDELHRQNSESLNVKINELGSRYLNENVKWISSSINQNNFITCKKRLQDAIDRCRGIGFDIPQANEVTLHANLKNEFEKAVRAAFLREEQARIRAQIREEQKREKEVQRELDRLDREREAIQIALQRALIEAQDQHSEEVEQLRIRLAEAEERSQRAISQAQLTKSGHVYVISNIGTFGNGVFKIGMTRRLEPSERIRELSSASVPFPFDVHMMISCDDAPALETSLHRRLHKQRINKINPRKEFFRVDLESIVEIVQENHGHVDYIIDAEALEYLQSQGMTDDDQEFIERVYDELDNDAEIDADDI